MGTGLWHATAAHWPCYIFDETGYWTLIFLGCYHLHFNVVWFFFLAGIFSCLLSHVVQDLLHSIDCLIVLFILRAYWIYLCLMYATVTILNWILKLPKLSFILLWIDILIKRILLCNNDILASYLKFFWSTISRAL